MRAEVRARLLAAGLGAEESDRLLGLALDLDRIRIIAHPEWQLDKASCRRVRELLEERLTGWSLAQLAGYKEFYSRTFRVNASVLVPRPETELAVETALERLEAGRAWRVADLGTGSGVIALTLAAEREALDVIATDRCGWALDVARANREALGLHRVTLLQGNWGTPLAAQQFDLVISNPPYIAESDPALDSLELAREPRLALASGADGLDAIRAISRTVHANLRRGGWFICEHGASQGPAVRMLFAEAGLQELSTRRDLAGHERVTLGRRCD